MGRRNVAKAAKFSDEWHTCCLGGGHKSKDENRGQHLHDQSCLLTARDCKGEDCIVEKACQRLNTDLTVAMELVWKGTGSRERDRHAGDSFLCHPYCRTFACATLTNIWALCRLQIALGECTWLFIHCFLWNLQGRFLRYIEAKLVHCLLR